jgi:hypothetical protein
MGINNFVPNATIATSYLTDDLTKDKIVYYNDRDELAVDPGPGPFLPSWISSPFLTEVINENVFRQESYSHYAKHCIEHQSVIFGSFEFAPSGSIGHTDTLTSFFATLRSIQESTDVSYLGDPMAHVYLPVYDSFDDTRSVVAVMMVYIHWRSYMRKILPSQVHGLVVVLENSCGGAFTYEINGPEASLMGFGDLHNPKFNDHVRSTSYGDNHSLADGIGNLIEIDSEGCRYYLHVYPSQVSLFSKK